MVPSDTTGGDLSHLFAGFLRGRGCKTGLKDFESKKGQFDFAFVRFYLLHQPYQIQGWSRGMKLITRKVFLLSVVELIVLVPEGMRSEGLHQPYQIQRWTRGMKLITRKVFLLSIVELIVLAPEGKIGGSSPAVSDPKMVSGHETHYTEGLLTLRC